MKETALTRTSGIALVMIGLLSMVGWVVHIPHFIAVNSDKINIVFNVALAFFLVGIAFLIPLKHKWQQSIRVYIGYIIAFLAIITLSQSVFKYSLGIDQFFINAWLADNNPYPGRMADNTALIFLFSGLSLILFPYVANKSISRLVQICTFSTLILGFSAFAGYLFKLKVLYSWNVDNQMSFLSAIGSSFLGLGLYSLWHYSEFKALKKIEPEKEEKEVFWIGFTILFCTVLLSAFALAKIFLSTTFTSPDFVSEVKSSVMLAVMVGMGIMLCELIPFMQRIIKSEKKLLNTNTLLRESENQIRSDFDNIAMGMALISNEEKRAEEQLRHLAYHDALTGLYNRNSLEEKMQESLLNAKRNDHGFSVIFIDLDRFKNINDTIGHDAGDMLLKIVSQRLKNNVRSSDTLARIGGDEFVLVLHELNQVEQISTILQNILTHLLQPIVIKGHEIYITSSIGVSVYPYDGKDIQTLMKNADLALYRAKELGRNNYQFCTFEMTIKSQQKMARQNAVAQAMAKNEFILYFQPKLHVVNKTIAGLEALLRWKNPEYSNINATEIVQLAEETGVIIGLNEWVFQTACFQVNEWHKNGFVGLNLSVNMSGKQFKQIDFVEHLLGMLDRTGFPPEHLELEITEGLIMQDPEYILHILHQLKEKKISIAIDDFGTGYSSLDYLRRFSIDKIKIDKKFIQTVTLDTAASSVVSAMIAMCNKLGIKTVAEGVETKEQYDFLVQEKCTEIQGYYLCPPADVVTISKFLKNPVLQP